MYIRVYYLTLLHSRYTSSEYVSGSDPSIPGYKIKASKMKSSTQKDTCDEKLDLEKISRLACRQEVINRVFAYHKSHSNSQKKFLFDF